MNEEFTFTTDTATLALFDPERLRHRLTDDSDWWCDSLVELDEVRNGVAAMASLGGDGVYRIRLTDRSLNCLERDYATDAVRGLGVEILSGKLFIGPGECLPADGFMGLTETRGGQVLACDNGNYGLDVYAISWAESPVWWREDGTRPTDAPADLIAVIRPREGAFEALEKEPRLLSDTDSFLFESTSRKVGPQPGMLLTTTVRKGFDGALCLKDCGPGDYAAALSDYAQVAWKDRIRVRVLDVDHVQRRFVGEFVAKL